MSHFAAKSDTRKEPPTGLSNGAPHRRNSVSDSLNLVSPPVVSAALNSAGSPLDAGIRASFENRFRRDFATIPAQASAASRGTSLAIAAPDSASEREADQIADLASTESGAPPHSSPDLSRVRVHTGATAAESAAAIGALAYTAGRDIFFGTGQYSPHTLSGRRLLFHELGHVMQLNDGHTIHRKSDPQLTKAELARKSKLDHLAAEPVEAHRAWKHLKSDEKAEVLSEMARRYGASFAQEFIAIAETGKFHDDLIYYQPGTGPKPEQLRQRGYRPAGEEHMGNAAYTVELWVHPNGNIVRRDVSPPKSATTKEPQPEPKPAAPSPQNVPPADNDDPDEYKQLDESTPLRKKILYLMQGLPMYNDQLWNEIQSLKANPTATERAEIEDRIKELRAEYDTDYADLLDLIDEASESDTEAFKYAQKNSGAINDHNAALLNDYNDLKNPPAPGPGNPP